MTLAKHIQDAVEQNAFEVLNAGFNTGAYMATRKIVFSVYEAVNGYFAETSGGALVIGVTLSEVCTAAQGKVAEEKLLEEKDGVITKNPAAGQWEKIP